MSAPGVYSYASAFRGSKARSSVNRKVAVVAKNRYKNKKVTSKLRRGPTKSIIKGNKSAIFALSKQVKTLQLEKFGNKQYQYQSCILPYPDGGTPMNTAPVAILLTSFYNDTEVYRGTVSPGPTPPLGTPVLNVAGNFRKQVYDTDLLDQYQYNERLNADTTVSKIEYLPVFTKLKVQLKGRILQTDPIIRYRFTVMKVKRLPPANATKDLTMPYALGALWHLAEDDPSIRNYFSKSYHTVLYDKWISIVPPSSVGATSTLYRSIEIPYSFPVKSVKMNLSAAPANQKVWTNIPEADQVYLIISCSAPFIPNIDVHLSRQLIFRDNHGVTS